MGGVRFPRNLSSWTGGNAFHIFPPLFFVPSDQAPQKNTHPALVCRLFLFYSLRLLFFYPAPRTQISHFPPNPPNLFKIHSIYFPPFFAPVFFCAPPRLRSSGVDFRSLSPPDIPVVSCDKGAKVHDCNIKAILPSVPSWDQAPGVPMLWAPSCPRAPSLSSAQGRAPVVWWPLPCSQPTASAAVPPPALCFWGTMADVPRPSSGTPLGSFDPKSFQGVVGSCQGDKADRSLHVYFDANSLMGSFQGVPSD